MYVDGISSQTHLEDASKSNALRICHHRSKRRSGSGPDLVDLVANHSGGLPLTIGATNDLSTMAETSELNAPIRIGLRARDPTRSNPSGTRKGHRSTGVMKTLDTLRSSYAAPRISSQLRHRHDVCYALLS
jgi:hypothetical protein